MLMAPRFRADSCIHPIPPNPVLPRRPRLVSHQIRNPLMTDDLITMLFSKFSNIDGRPYSSGGAHVSFNADHCYESSWPCHPSLDGPVERAELGNLDITSKPFKLELHMLHVDDFLVHWPRGLPATLRYTAFPNSSDLESNWKCKNLQHTSIDASAAPLLAWYGMSFFCRRSVGLLFNL